MVNKVKGLTKDRLVEIGFFIAMFVLTMLHEWIKITTFMDFVKGFVFFMILYILAQFHRSVLLPLLLQKAFWRYGILSMGALLLGAALISVTSYFWIEPEFYQSEAVSRIWLFFYSFAICVVSTMTIMGLFLWRQYYKEMQGRAQAELLLSEMNIKLLHAQLNPHFFFNMFNNLYGVSLSEPNRVPSLIVKLSGMMRYQLEKGNKPLVRIEDELEFIANYIDMEKERVGRRCEIIFSSKLDNNWFNRFQISPLILITLVENAFKHSLTISSKWFVHIQIIQTGNILTMKIENSSPDESLKNGSTAIGLHNVKRRLELLYTDSYTFSTNFTDTGCHTHLTLKLNHK